MRRTLHSSMGDLFKIKHIKENINFENVGQIRQLFTQSLGLFYQSVFEEADQEFDKENLSK